MAQKPKLSVRPALRLHGRLKLAQLVLMREEEFSRLIDEAESRPMFGRLTRAGAVRITPFSKAYFTARRFAGRSLAASEDGLAELLDGNSEIVRLIRGIGRERFEECFLRGEGLTDAERSRRCGVPPDRVRFLRDFLDKMYVRGEFETAPPAVPGKVYSTVAGISIQGGQPVLHFFNREVWKGRYRVDERMLEHFLSDLSTAERGRVRRYLSRLEFLNRRKTTVFKTLEALLRAQEAYLRTGDPWRLEPLTQRSVAAAVGSEPSVINRLISNKAVELPWGTEAPLKSLFPSGKAVARGKLAALAKANPGLSDEGLRRELAEKHHVHLSRRSVAQYRKDLGLGGRGRR